MSQSEVYIRVPWIKNQWTPAYNGIGLMGWLCVHLRISTIWHLSQKVIEKPERCGFGASIS